jgi:SIR2-like domain
MPFSFPKPIRRAYNENKLAILVGSGASIAKDVKGPFPKWDQLTTELLKQIEEFAHEDKTWVESKRKELSQKRYRPLDSRLQELDDFKTRLGTNYQAAINAIFRPLSISPGDIHRALDELDVPLLVTTNYDHLLEHAEKSTSRRARYTWKEAESAISDVRENRKVIFKIHGTAERCDTIIMTRTEYHAAATEVRYQRAMSFFLANYTFLLVGYGNNDPHDLDMVFELNKKAFGSANQTHYALMKKAADGESHPERDRWKTHLNIAVIEYDNHEELPQILDSLRAEKLEEKSDPL